MDLLLFFNFVDDTKSAAFFTENSARLLQNSIRVCNDAVANLLVGKITMENLKLIIDNHDSFINLCRILDDQKQVSDNFI